MEKKPETTEKLCYLNFEFEFCEKCLATQLEIGTYFYYLGIIYEHHGWIHNRQDVYAIAIKTKKPYVIPGNETVDILKRSKKSHSGLRGIKCLKNLLGF